MPVKCEACGTFNSIDSRSCRDCAALISTIEPEVEPAPRELTEFEVAMVRIARTQTAELRAQNETLEEIRGDLHFIYWVTAVQVTAVALAVGLALIAVLGSS